MEQWEVETRLCKLTTHVMSEVFVNRIPADCWCPLGEDHRRFMDRVAIGGNNYRFHEGVLAFIEASVKHMIDHFRCNDGVATELVAPYLQDPCQ